MRAGIYNVQHGHPVPAHVSMILSRFDGLGIDVLALTEVADYVDALQARAARHGHTVLFKDGTTADRSQAFLVRKGVHIGRCWSIPIAATYYATNGDLRHSQPPYAATLNGIVFVVGHAPVGAWTTSKRGRRFVGPIRRRLAYRAYMLRLARVFRRAHHPVIAWCDWNCTPAARGRWSPNWLRTKVGGTFVRPGHSTGHGEIDYAIAGGIIAAACVTRGNPAGLPHSDHFLVTADLDVKGVRR